MLVLNYAKESHST